MPTQVGHCRDYRGVFVVPKEGVGRILIIDMAGRVLANEVRVLLVKLSQKGKNFKTINLSVVSKRMSQYMPTPAEMASRIDSPAANSAILIGTADMLDVEFPASVKMSQSGLSVLAFILRALRFINAAAHHCSALISRSDNRGWFRDSFNFGYSGESNGLPNLPKMEVFEKDNLPIRLPSCALVITPNFI